MEPFEPGPGAVAAPDAATRAAPGAAPTEQDAAPGDLAPATAGGTTADAPGAGHFDHAAPARLHRSTTRSLPTLIAAIAVAVLVGSALFVSGFWVGRERALSPGTAGNLQEAFQPFWDAFNAIDQRYAGGTVDRHALIEGAINGMFEALDDPYSSYMTGEEYRKSLQGVSGQFEGIGATLSAQSENGEQCSPAGESCALVVVRPLPGSPAEKAGLLAGDEILTVDRTPVVGKTLDEVVQLVRGPRGTQVVLGVSRSAGEPLDVTITRDVISSVDVTSRVLADGRVGYLRIDSFGARVAADFSSQLGDLVTSRHLTRIVVDLRDDPGGFVDQARTIASQFIASGPILWQEAAGGVLAVQEAEPGGAATDPSIEVVVLVNRGTASASEIVAGALQDTGRARLVGEQTYGKGTIQEWQVLGGDTGGFRLTIARWLTPDKRWIHNVGLVPDVAVSAEGAAAGTDPVLDRAIELLVGQPALVPVARAA